MKVWLSGVNGAGKYTEVDPEDYVRVSRYKWYLRNTYAVAIMEGKSIRLHRFILGEDDPSVIVDHINRDRLDNQSKNLRRLTAIENANNRHDNVRITVWGETQTIAEWSRDERCSVNYNVLQKRIYGGVQPELAILAVEYE